MTKKQFLKDLKKALGNQPEALEIIVYYDELIEEAKLNGEQEEDAISRLGSIEDIIASLGQQPAGTFKAKATKVKKLLLKR